LRVAGIAEGGLLTSADLASIVDLDLAAQPHPTLEDWLEAPWASYDFPSLAYSDPESSAPPDATNAMEAETMSGRMRSSDTLLMVLCAVDARGVFAGATYTWTTNGITIDELDLELPTHAIPVMRGVTRIAPGSALPSAAPIAVRIERGRPIAMVGDPRSDRLDLEAINRAQFRLNRDPETRVVTICD
jgi:gamma-glutamyltranspeptidase/glutathione hydrolase